MKNTNNRILSIGVFNNTSRCYSITGPYLDEINNQSEFSFYVNYLEYYKKFGNNNFNKFIIDYIFKYKITHIFIFLTGWDFTLSPKLLFSISKSTPIILFTYDTEYYFENLERYYAQFADLVVTADKFSSFAFQELNINSHCAFSMYDGINKYRKLSLIKDIDVSFIGNLNIGKRKFYIDFLKKNNINIKDYGLNSTNDVIDEDKMIEIINRSKIVLNFTGLQNFTRMPPGIPRIRARIKQSKGRPIEIGLCGSFLLTETSPGIEYMYDISNQVAVFSKEDELLEKIIFYLKNESNREQMALNCHNYSIDNYELKSGFKKIFIKLSKVNHIKIDSDFYLDIPFKIEYYITHLKYALFFLFKFKITAFWDEIIILVNTNSFSFKRLIQEFNWYRIRILEKFKTLN